MLSVIVILSIGVVAHAQTPSATPAPTPSLEKDFFKNFLKDQKAIWTAPFHLDRDDAKWLVPGSIGTMALITTDRMTGDEIAEFDGPRNASRIISYAGSTYGVGLMAGTFYLVGRKTHNSRARETGILSAEAILDSVVVVTALKGITARGRPHSGIDRSEFFDGGRSFPSGHSIQAWSAATIVANEYHSHPLVQVAAYGIASAVSVARFTGGNHYLSDVLVGSALGYGIGQYVYRAHHRVSTHATMSGAEEDIADSRYPFIAPRFNHRTHEYGATLTWSF
jgi:membrane-associated phospholipid phosphatase